jgi:hypothetical protein
LARARDAPSDCTASSSAGSIDWIELRIGKIMNGRKTCTNPTPTPTALYISVRLYGNRPSFFTALLIRPLLAKRMIRP